ncbi:MAG: methyltransferase domain-containing protein [Gammaproteobacteria bacterium]|nr:MAG: methyltransferase domain-containing protein [Gammaproteobacteria bacterium]
MSWRCGGKSVSEAEAWEERYRSGKTGWDRGAPSPALLGWLQDRTLTPCRILVPGCGRGYEVVELARRGFEVTAVDIAPTPVAFLRQALQEAGLKAQVIQADLLDFQPDIPFDAIYEQTCLCALAPDAWPAYAERLERWLAPSGRLFALFMQTGSPGGPPYHCDLEAMERLFPASLWRWPAPPYPAIPHPSGFHERAVVLSKRP